MKFKGNRMDFMLSIMCCFALILSFINFSNQSETHLQLGLFIVCFYVLDDFSPETPCDAI